MYQNVRDPVLWRVARARISSKKLHPHLPPARAKPRRDYPTNRASSEFETDPDDGHATYDDVHRVGFCLDRH